MAKLGRNEMPSGHTRDDFECFGPVATKDTEFGGCKLADLGCFKQDEGTDSNKYYHAAVVRSKKDGKWYLYVEYGRTVGGKPNKPQYQFTECPNEQSAMGEFAKQCASKNTKRGQWETVGSKQRYTPKAKKGGTEDLYVVRYMASRVVGLPAAANISNEDAVGAKKAAAAAAATAAPKKGAAKAPSRYDKPTLKLFRDLIGGAVTYTKTTMVGGAIPAQSALDDARDLLQDAMGRIVVVGDNVQDQINDQEIKRLTYLLYGMVPKAKPQGAAEADWILSKDNIRLWQADIDAFETALQNADIEETGSEDDAVMAGIPADLEFLPLDSELGKYISEWWVSATRNRHSHVGGLKVKNLWRVSRHGDDKVMLRAQDDTINEMPKSWNNERPLHQDKKRLDLSSAQRRVHWESNTALMFHGTRSINVPGIVRENLRFPNQLKGVIITGAMFGPGSYFADDWKKSAGYCSNPRPGRSTYYGGGGEVQGRNAFMFAFDVICGNPHVAPDAYGFTQPPSPHHCVFGKAGHTSSWGRSGGLMNNEWIIYKKGRIEMKYLAEIEF